MRMGMVGVSLEIGRLTRFRTDADGDGTLEYRQRARGYRGGQTEESRPGAGGHAVSVLLLIPPPRSGRVGWSDHQSGVNRFAYATEGVEERAKATGVASDTQYT